MNAMPVGAGDAQALAVFVYFRSAPEARETVEAALHRQLGLVRARTGLPGRFGERHANERPYATWLEVYEGVPPSALAATLEAIARASTDSGLAGLALEGRHIEVFAIRA